MTNSWLMEANCVHGVVWFECKQCEAQIDIPVWESKEAEDLGLPPLDFSTAGLFTTLKNKVKKLFQSS